MKWSDQKNLNQVLISEHKGDEAGIKSSTIKISRWLCFWMVEKRVRNTPIVRISPFDSGARRHTSFASVWVYPVVDENIDRNFR